MPGITTTSLGALEKLPVWKGGIALQQQNQQHDTILEDLLERVKRDDAVAFENLVSHTQKKAFGLAYNLIGDYHQAQDVLQEAYLRAYRHIHSLKNPRAFHSWLARIVINCANEYFKGKKHLEIKLDSLEGASAEEPAMAEAAATRERVQDALQSLPAHERSTILLREYYQMKYQEIARILKIPVGTVRSRLSEARKRLVNLVRRGEV